MATYLDIINAFITKQQIVIGIMGSSVAIGYGANGYSNFVDMGDGYFITTDGNGRWTAPTNYSSIAGWAQQFEVWIKTFNSTSIVYNLSESGGTTGTAISTGSVAAFAAMNPKPSIILIPLVINDAKQGSGQRATFNANMQTLITSILTAGMIPVLMKEHPIGTFVTTSYILNVDGQNFNSDLDTLATSNNIAIIDLNTPALIAGAINKPILQDPFHFNIYGHSYAVNEVQKFFLQNYALTRTYLPNTSTWTTDSGLDDRFDGFTNNSRARIIFPWTSQVLLDTASHISVDAINGPVLTGGKLDLTGGGLPYLDVHDHPLVQLAGQDFFTMQFIMNTPSMDPTPFQRFVVSKGGVTGWGFALDTDGVHAFLTLANNGGDIYFVHGMSPNVDYHVAIVCASGVTTVYIGGVAVGSSSVPLQEVLGADVLIGTWLVNVASYQYNGFVKNFELFPFAKWTSNFTPPTTLDTVESTDIRTATTPWISLNKKHFDPTNPIILFENTVSSYRNYATGNIQYRCAVNNNPFSGPKLTGTQLKSLIAASKITNTTNSIRFEITFNGSQTLSSTDAMTRNIYLQQNNNNFTNTNTTDLVDRGSSKR